MLLEKHVLILHIMCLNKRKLLPKSVNHVTGANAQTNS